MAFRKGIAHRAFNLSNTTVPSSLTACRISSAAKPIAPPEPDNPSLDPRDAGVRLRFLHRRSIYHSPATSPQTRWMPVAGKLLEELRKMDIARARIQLGGLLPPAEEAGRLLRLSQLEAVKARLRRTEGDTISHAEFVRICGECTSSRDLASEVAKMLDDSGTVIVFGNIVSLKPEKVLKAIQGLMPAPLTHPNDPRKKELEQLERQKSMIDKRAESQVRRELWGGLGYLVVQTSAFMRLTFWELTWDVMEPICFYVTSMYFMAGYAFFLRTSKEPSFEGFFQSRFTAKQKKLMKLDNFDIERYNELREALHLHSPAFHKNAKSFALSSDRI